MAGTKPGPAPKDPDVRQRTNKPATEEVKLGPADLPAYVDVHPQPPEPNEKWHHVARAIYDGLISDPARMNMTSGDWALWMLTIENVHLDMQPQVVGTTPAVVSEGEVIPGDVIRERIAMNGSRMANVLKLAALTGLTDGARRSMGIHLRLGTTSADLQGEQNEGVKSRAELFLVTPPEERA